MAVKKTESFPKVRIRLVKSMVGRTAAQRAVVRGLGLNKMQSSVIREKRPEIMGMVRKIDFMLEVTEVEQ